MNLYFSYSKKGILLSTIATLTVSTLFLASTTSPQWTNTYYAQAVPPTGPQDSGNGELTILNPGGKVKPGGLLFVQGTGFNQGDYGDLVLKINETDFSVDDDSDDIITKNNRSYLKAEKKPRAGQTDFLFSIRIPEQVSRGDNTWNLREKDSQVRLRILGQTQSSAISIPVEFSVDPDAAGLAEFLSADDKGGRIKLTDEHSPFAEGDVISAKLVGGEKAQFRQRRILSDTYTVGPGGSITTDIDIPLQGLGAGEYFMLTLANTDEHKKSAHYFYRAQPTISLTSTYEGQEVRNMALGSTGVKLSVFGLSPDTVVTSLTLDGHELLKESKVAGADKKLIFEGLTIPSDPSLAGKRFVLGYQLSSGTIHTYSSPNVFATASTQPFGSEKFDSISNNVHYRLYQTVYDQGANKLYLTSAVGRPPIDDSRLSVVNPENLEVEKFIIPEKVPETLPTAQGRYAVYGVGFDETNGHIWTTNTRQDTISVYDRDLKLLKQFPPKTTTHARDVVVDQRTQKVYISAPAGGQVIDIFDSKTLEKIGTIDVSSRIDSPMSLVFDQDEGILFTVDLRSPNIAAIFVREEQPRVEFFDLSEVPDFRSGSGIAWDAKRKIIYVTGQGSGNLVGYSLVERKVIANIPVGDQPLNALWDEYFDQLWIVNRTSGNAVVLDAHDRSLIAVIPVGAAANHISTDGKGNIFIVNRDDHGEAPHITNKLYKFRYNGTKSSPDQKDNSGSSPSLSSFSFINTLFKWLFSNSITRAITFLFAPIISLFKK